MHPFGPDGRAFIPGHARVLSDVSLADLENLRLGVYPKDDEDDGPSAHSPPSIVSSKGYDGGASYHSGESGDNSTWLQQATSCVGSVLTFFGSEGRMDALGRPVNPEAEKAWVKDSVDAFMVENDVQLPVVVRQQTPRSLADLDEALHGLETRAQLEVRKGIQLTTHHAVVQHRTTRRVVSTLLHRSNQLSKGIENVEASVDSLSTNVNECRTATIETQEALDAGLRKLSETAESTDARIANLAGGVSWFLFHLAWELADPLYFSRTGCQDGWVLFIPQQPS